MDEDRTERELKSVFEALRNEEAHVAPAFEPLVRASLAWRGSRRPWS